MKLNIELFNHRTKTEEDCLGPNLCDQCNIDHRLASANNSNDIPSPMNPNNIDHLSNTVSS